MERCTLCPKPDTVDVSSGHHIPLCAACLAGMEATPSTRLPWETSFNPESDGLLDAIVDALVMELRGAVA